MTNAKWIFQHSKFIVSLILVFKTYKFSLDIMFGEMSEYDFTYVVFGLMGINTSIRTTLYFCSLLFTIQTCLSQWLR